MRFIYTALIPLLFVVSATSQNLESVTYLESFQKDEISSMIGLSVNYGVDLYKVRYYTPDINGDEHVASGLICIPQSQSRSFPLACYQHGTVGSRDDVPSNLQGGYLLAVIFASYGYVITTPDYLGLGDSPGIHPYVHAATEASAAIDLLYAARELDAQDDTFSMNDQLFITGYSQGGHASMAAHQEIQTNYSQDFTVTAAAHMSGPYSLSEKMMDFTLGDNEYLTPSFIASAMLGFKEVYPEILQDYEIEDIFQAQYVGDVLAYGNEEITLWELNDRFIEGLISEHGVVRPRDLLIEEVVDAILNDPMSPFSVVLQDNDTYNWAPEAPTRLYYCEADDVVNFDNAILAEAEMNANGASDLLAVKSDVFTPQDHSGCVLPASFSGILFFGAYQNILTSTEDIFDDPNLTINNNNQILLINIPPAKYRSDNKLLLHDMSGRTIFETNADSGMTYHDIADIPGGMYIINILHKNNLIKTGRIVKF
ncbi:MAG: T9SS type A sorting domain-containing protein [Bacteroidia bacterium]|nr:T9SS type A sorting domain-containing protein [Bacteroidia bacterium]